VVRLTGEIKFSAITSTIIKNAKIRHNAEVVYRPLTVPTPIMAIAAAWHQNAFSPTLDNFLALIKSLVLNTKR
jgi:hypothetical protein